MLVFTHAPIHQTNKGREGAGGGGDDIGQGQGVKGRDSIMGTRSVPLEIQQ